MNGLVKAKNSIMAADEIVVPGGLGIEKLGKRAYMLSCDGIPQRYRKLPGGTTAVILTLPAVPFRIAGGPSKNF